MIRVKLPFGGVTPEQMEAFADVVEKYAPLNKGHITTRQNIQIHHVPLRDAAEAASASSPTPGLSSREGCGNTVRNVTGDPWAGICDDELFDPTPYAGAYVRYFVRHPTTQLMPRKVKTAFDGTAEDRAITGIHDIAFIARVKDGVQGFEVRVGGGTSIMPRIAPTLYDFVEADDGEYLKVAEAVFRIFDRQDWLRVNRARARIKVFVDKFGIEELRNQVEEELQGDWVAERDFDVRGPALRHRRGGARPGAAVVLRHAQRRRARSSTASPSPTSCRQRQEGFSAVEVKVTRGDLTPQQFRGLARDHARRTPAASPARPSARTSSCAGSATRRSTTSGSELKELGLGDAGAQEITDVVSCPGTDSCKLGITSLDGPQRARSQKRLLEMEITDPLTRRIHIKISGCPNGCSQHHIADIGFYGASIKVGEHTIPAYVAHIGGQYDDGDVGYGTRLKVRLPAKRVPDAVERWMRMYEAERNDGEIFNDYAERVGTKRFEDEARDLALPVEFGLENDEHVHRLEPQACPSRSSAARASARCEHPGGHPLGDVAGGRQARAADVPLLLPEGGERHPRRAAARGAARPGRHDRHGRAVPRDARDVEALRGPLRRPRRGGGRGAVGCAVDPAPPTAARHRRSRRSSGRWPARTPGSPASAASRDELRADAEPVEWDDKRSMWKYNPLVAWTEKDLWRRIHERALPYHPLHDQGLLLDRLRAVHGSGRGPRGPLGGHGQDRVRAARLTGWTRWSSHSVSASGSSSA